MLTGRVGDQSEGGEPGGGAEQVSQPAGVTAQTGQTDRAPADVKQAHASLAAGADDQAPFRALVRGPAVFHPAAG
ncbi:hypothetical protein [Streptomyces jumonjinensis]|uniref:hypothetical protein n=1 Tax=Streptomyces jumonjinensis TaxID=1945 RepID=UPI0037B6D120